MKPTKIEIAHAFMAMVSAALAQGVTDKIAPEGATPAGCELTSPGEFEITIVKVKGDFGKQKQLAVEVRFYSLVSLCVASLSHHRAVDRLCAVMVSPRPQGHRSWSRGSALVSHLRDYILSCRIEPARSISRETRRGGRSPSEIGPSGSLSGSSHWRDQGPDVGHDAAQLIEVLPTIDSHLAAYPRVGIRP